MKKYFPLFLFILIASSVSSCIGGDPWKADQIKEQAQADALRIQSEQSALNEEQNRRHAEDMHKIQAQEVQAVQQERVATAAQWEAAMRTMIRTGSIFATVALSMVLVSAGVGLSFGFIGAGRAAAQGAMIRANLIYLDPTTRQFPIFIQHVHGTRFALHNPNTGSVLMLDEKHEADRQLIATAGATQIAGVLAQEARKSSDPAGVAVIQPPVIDAQDEAVSVGRRV